MSAAARQPGGTGQTPCGAIGGSGAASHQGRGGAPEEALRQATLEPGQASTSTLRVICGWCRVELPPQPCTPEMAGQVSHGLCPTCAAAWRAQSAAFKAQAQGVAACPTR